MDPLPIIQTQEVVEKGPTSLAKRASIGLSCIYEQKKIRALHKSWMPANNFARTWSVSQEGKSGKEILSVMAVKDRNINAKYVQIRLVRG